jgi:hypothetical protein
MDVLNAILWLAGLFPLMAAWQANRRTSLLHTIIWAIVAWAVWGCVIWTAESPVATAIRYVALSLTGAVGVAALGARRPYVGAWNFVVIGLVAVTNWPLIESLLIGTEPRDPLRVFFLSATVAVGLLNYLPTRNAPAVVVAVAGLGGELVALFAASWLPGEGSADALHLLVLVTPWIAWACWRWSRRPASEFDQLWRGFRDRFGFLWAQRMREQFNHAAANAGWPVRLTWRGLHRTRSQEAIPPADQEAMVVTLRKVLQRFMAAEAGSD